MVEWDRINWKWHSQSTQQNGTNTDRTKKWTTFFVRLHLGANTEETDKCCSGETGKCVICTATSDYTNSSDWSVRRKTEGSATLTTLKQGHHPQTALLKQMNDGKLLRNRAWGGRRLWLHKSMGTLPTRTTPSPPPPPPPLPTSDVSWSSAVNSHNIIQFWRRIQTPHRNRKGCQGQSSTALVTFLSYLLCTGICSSK